MEQKSTKSDAESNNENQFNKISMKTLAEQEAFDEIIALKFQRWFPNTATDMPGGSSSEDDSNNLELLSYRERKFQTCEYRYEVLKKNNKSLTFDKFRNHTGFKNNKQKIKKFNGKVRSKVVRSPISHADSDGGLETTNDAKDPDKNDNERINIDLGRGCEFDEIEYTEHINPSTKLVDLKDERQTESVLGDTDPLQLLAEQDLRMLQAKQNSNAQTDVKKHAANKPVKEVVEQKQKTVKNSLIKSANSLSPRVSPNKKQKKISFLVDRRGSGELQRKKDDFENIGSSAGNADSVFENNTDIEKDEKLAEHSRDGAYDKLREMTISPQQPAGSQIEDVLSWMGFHRPPTPRSKMVR